MYHLVVIGGGPSGSVGAREAVKRGLKVVLIEKKRNVGRPVHCTGLFSKRTIETLTVSPSLILNEIKGAHIYSPDKRCLTIASPNTQAYVVDRESFDKELLFKAEEEGVEVHLETEGIGIDGNTIRVNHKGKESLLRSEVFVGAWGHQKEKRSPFGNFPPHKKNLYGLQMIGSYSVKDKNFVELFFGNRYSDCFFGWAVPLRKKLAKIGLLSSSFSKSKEGLKNLLEDLNLSPEKAPIGGIIPIGPPKRTVADNILICGDAAAHAKPTSGGGVYTGTLCAMIAGKTVADHLNKEVPLLRYDKEWREKIEKELRMGMLIHRLLSRMTDRRLNGILKVLSQEGFTQLIKKYGDMDYPSSLIRHFMSIPSFWKDMIWGMTRN